MEKRGSGLKKICDKTALLPQYIAARKPTFKSKPGQEKAITSNEATLTVVLALIGLLISKK